MIGWLLGILGLALLMVVHEGGHFLAARAFGMRVTTFSIGFGPTFFKIVPQDGYFWLNSMGDKVHLRLFRHDPEKHGPTVYQVAMIPFLAYVQIAGMNPLEEIDPEDKGSFANARLFPRIVAIFGGPLANYLFASVLFFASFFFGGMPVPSEGTDVSPLKEEPAAMAGMRQGDKIVEVSGQPVSTWEQMAKAISTQPDAAIPIVIDRAGERVTLNITPKRSGERTVIGVAPMTTFRSVGVGEASVLAIKTPVKVVKDVVVNLGQLVTGKVASKDLSGPIGIVSHTAEAASRGWTDLVFFLGILSAYLGAFNLIPFPALDGGRLVFLGYEAIARRRPNARIEANIHAVGLVMMLGLMVYVTLANDLGLGGSK